MTPAERGRLLDLLGKQLRSAHRAGNARLFYHSWRTLWALGAQVHVHDDEDITIVTST